MVWRTPSSRARDDRCTTSDGGACGSSSRNATPKGSSRAFAGRRYQSPRRERECAFVHHRPRTLSRGPSAEGYRGKAGSNPGLVALLPLNEIVRRVVVAELSVITRIRDSRFSGGDSAALMHPSSIDHSLIHGVPVAQCGRAPEQSASLLTCPDGLGPICKAYRNPDAVGSTPTGRTHGP